MNRAEADKMVLAGRQAAPARHQALIGVALLELDEVIAQGVDDIV